MQLSDLGQQIDLLSWHKMRDFGPPVSVDVMQLKKPVFDLLSPTVIFFLDLGEMILILLNTD